MASDDLERQTRAAPSITLRCRRHDADGVAPCLAAVHPEALAALLLRARERTVRVDLTACDRCPSGALRPVIEAQVAQARRFALTVAGDASVEIDLERAAPASTAAPPPSLDRRALFGQLRAQAHALVVHALAVDGPDRGGRVPHRAELLHRARACVAGSDAPPPSCDVAGAFFVAWDVDGACDGCSASGGPACVRACPNRAWTIEHGEGAATLRHDPASCSACGACQRACPRGALSARPALVTAGDGPQARRRVPSTRCRACRRATAVDADGLCAHCAKRQRIAAPQPSVSLGVRS